MSINNIEIITLQDIYKLHTFKDKKTNEVVEDYKLVKKNARSKRVVSILDIRSIEEEISITGKVYKSKFKMSLSGEEKKIIVSGNYSTFKDKIFKEPIRDIGFKFY